MSVLKIKYTELLIFIVSAELVGALSAMITEDFDSFFDRYASPPLMPHSWLFSVVWAAVLILLIVLVVLMITAFKKISPTAARLNIPYQLWLIFAAYLNIATAIING